MLYNEWMRFWSP